MGLVGNFFVFLFPLVVGVCSFIRIDCVWEEGEALCFFCLFRKNCVFYGVFLSPLRWLFGRGVLLTCWKNGDGRVL